MSDEVLVRAEYVSKRFCRSLKRSLWYGLQDLGSELGGRRHGGGRGLPESNVDIELRKDEFWALKNVSFELRRGECLGLIGRNGAGKTTLLRMLNGLIKPDSGRIQMRGRIGALIALGAGFNPLLSGRENIHINTAVLGISSKVTKDLVDQIVDFSGLSSFLDAPLQTYSSGMQVRLGFSIAVHQNPDILILDEVLAVGDKQFRTKCLNRILEIKKNCAILFVSHASDQLARVCDHGLVLNQGCMVGSLQPISKAILDYETLLPSDSAASAPDIFCTPEVSVQCVDQNIELSQIDDQIQIRALCKNLGNEQLSLHIVIRRESSLEVVCESYLYQVIPCGSDELSVSIIFSPSHFSSGVYLVSVSLVAGPERYLKAFHINGSKFSVPESLSPLRGAISSILNIHSSYQIA